MPVLPTMHMVACFHTLLTDDYSHCAFSGKCRRWAKMMKPYGWDTIVYTNEGSIVPDATVVTLLNAEEFARFYPRKDKTQFHGDHAVIGDRGWPDFNSRLIVELSKRIKPGDIILHPFGRAHEQLVNVFPQCIHTESGIGYGDKPFGAWRIFESQAWRHYHWGRWDHDGSVPQGEKGQNRYYSWVVPNYFDLDDWAMGSGKGDYVVYMGRITPEKGMSTIGAIIREYAKRSKATSEVPPRFVFAGQGDFEKNVMEYVLSDPRPEDHCLNIEYVGPVHGRKRSELIGNARCMLMPSSFIEPFAGSGVESMICGTPLISVDYGAFTETIREGVSGYRCNTLGDWVNAIEASKKLDRATVAAVTRERYSLQACGKLYDTAFRQLNELRGAGWYSTQSNRVQGAAS